MTDIFHGRRTATIALLVPAGCLMWALWPSMAAMADRWASDPRYAHGYFVPMFAAALLWMRRERLSQGGAPRPSTWGLVPVAIGAALQVAGGYLGVEWLDGVSLLPYLAGLALLIGGRRALAWSWPSIAFLVFMVPLPWRIETALGGPLQTIATLISTYSLQTLGLMAFSEGNVIQLNEGQIGVVEACNGLSMLITFIALSTAAALVVRRPLLDRLVLVASAIPVALLANIFRICLTGVLQETVGGHASSTFYHDLAGWVMMPLALALYWLEIAVLARLLLTEQRPGTRSALAMVEARRRVAARPSPSRGLKPSSY
jgi:exosortase